MKTTGALLIIAVSFILSACGPNFGQPGTISQAQTSGVTIAPMSVTLAPGQHQQFQGAGGTGTFNWSLSPGGTGTISSTGLYTAPSTPGTDVVVSTDSAGASAYSTVTISTSGGTVAIAPATLSLAPSATYTFAASGGTGSYTYSVPSGVGSITPGGLFTAPSTTGTTTVVVTDSGGATASSAVTIAVGAGGSSLQIAPTMITVQGLSSTQFSALGGSGTYTYTLYSGIGSVSASGLYMAPAAAGTAIVQVQDSSGATAYGTVTVMAVNGLAPVYRFFNGAAQDHEYSLSMTADSGYTLEGAAFRVYASYSAANEATTPLYQCMGGAGSHFLSVAANCEGGTYQGIVGYLFNQQVSGSTPLYRFQSQDGHDHIATTDFTEGVSLGYYFEATLGYASN
jgi:hypothetical protein